MKNKISQKNNKNNNRNKKTNITLIQILGLFLFLTNGTQNDYIVSYRIFLNFLPMLYKTTLA